MISDSESGEGNRKVRRQTYFPIAAAALLAAIAWGAGRKPAAPPATTVAELPTLLRSGKPTLAFVYYSVACSCTAAHCAAAEAALDSALGEDGLAGNVNVLKVDGYAEDAADSIFGIGLVPLIVHYDKSGVETGRIEWEIAKAMVEGLLAAKAAAKNEE
jgi:hypothetical protein